MVGVGGTFSVVTGSAVSFVFSSLELLELRTFVTFSMISRSVVVVSLEANQTKVKYHNHYTSLNS